VVFKTIPLYVVFGVKTMKPPFKWHCKDCNITYPLEVRTCRRCGKHIFDDLLEE